MNKTVSAIVSGMAAAAIVGTTVYMMNDRSRSMQKVKRNAAKTVRAMGSIVDGITEMVR